MVACYPNYLGGIGIRIAVLLALGKKQDPV
jgi:hypothetical protein